MFTKATRMKLRFDSPKGQLTVEDLWDLQLTSQSGKTNLDDIAKALYAQMKNEAVSFVKPASASDETIKLKFDIVKHIIDTRVIERDDAAQAALRREKKQQISALIEQKKAEALGQTSIAELEALLAQL